MENVIDIENQTFTFANQNISIIFDGANKPWFKGNDIAILLGYRRPRKFIHDHVDEGNKTTFSELEKFNKSPKPVRSDTVYIDEASVSTLLTKRKQCDEFSTWVFGDLLPALRTIPNINIENERISRLQDIVNKTKTENEQLREIVKRAKLQQVFSVFADDENDRNSEKIYKCVDAKLKNLCSNIEGFKNIYQVEYIPNPNTSVMKKIIDMLDNEDVEYDYNDKQFTNLVTIEGDYDFVDCVKRVMRHELLW